MNYLYKKSKLLFSLIWIAAYVVLSTLADKFSGEIGIKKVINAPLFAAMVLIMIMFITRNKLQKEYGLCSFKGSYKGVLFYIPLIVILSINLWNGFEVKGTVLEEILFIISMLCVGFIEEMLFRGFLFKTLCEDNIKVAILVSSLTFGFGHIINLLRGAEFLPTLLQICYATALGFLFTTLFYKGKSLWICIIAHSIMNVLSGYNVIGTDTYRTIISLILCVVSVGYALYIWKYCKTK